MKIFYEDREMVWHY